MSKVCEIKEYIKKLPVPLEAMEFLNTIHNNIFKELEESKHFYKWDKVLWESKQPTKLNNGRKLIGEINRRYGSVVAQISRTIYPSKPNVRVDVTPLVGTYSVPKEELPFVNKQLKLALTNEIQEYETPAGINIGETTGLLWGNFTYSERKGIFEQSETPASYVQGSSFNDSLQNRTSGKSFTEVWNSNEFSDSEKTTVLVHSIQQRLHNRDSFNGRLFDKINKQLGMLDIRILNSSNLSHPAFNFDKQIYVNPEALFNDFKANIPGDRVDGYLDLVLAEELIHVVTNYMLTPELKGSIARELSVSTYTGLQSIYQGIQPGDSQLAIMEYIRMIVQDEFLNTTSEQFRFPEAYSLGSFLADVWRFIMDAFKQNSGNLKQIVKQHISFIEEQSSIENISNSEEIISPLSTFNLEEGLDWIKEVLPNASIELREGLINDIARGAYTTLGDVILASKEYADKGTIKHEAGHWIFNKLSKKEQEDLLNEGSKLFNIPRGKSEATIKYSLSQQTEVNYVLKAVDILQSDKAKQIFDKGNKSGWSLDKILTELSIPKEQKAILLQMNTNDREELLTELVSNYSFTIDINLSTEPSINKNINYEHDDIFDEDGNFQSENTTFYINGYLYEKDWSKHIPFGYGKIKSEDGYIGDNKWESIVEYEYNEALEEFKNKEGNERPTSYYSNLTVPGGINGSYIEANIETPMIVPSIQSHAQFKTDNTVGWMRADEKQNYQEKNIDKNGLITLVHYSSKNTNPLDNFQEDYPLYMSKGENSEYQDYGKKYNFLIKGTANIKSILDFHGKYGIDLDQHDMRSKGIQPYHFSLQEIQAIRKEGVDILIDDWGEYIILNPNSLVEKSNIKNETSTKTRRILEVQSDLFQKGRDKKDLIGGKIEEGIFNPETGEWDIPEDWGKEIPSNEKQNQFLQLLNKDGRWIEVFVKSILQDSAKQTITEVQESDVEAVVKKLEKEGLLKIDCKGKLKAEKGLQTNFTKGGKWKLIKDLKGYPTHKEGGVDLTINKDGVSIKNGNTQFTAKYGLVIPKN